MEPQTSAPKPGPEQAPTEHGPTVEHIPLPRQPEQGLLETGAEQTEQASEAASRASDNAGMAPVMPPSVIVSDDPIADDQTAIDSPVIAGDDDLIEKEWVDRAKKIVAEVRDDPYKQENAVTQLQKDYQKKRFGRELGEAN